MTLAIWISVFLASAGALVLAGIALARAGDEIATRTGVGGLLVGGVLVAAATSLPEVATGMSAAAEGAPELAVGSIFGSSMANMAILAVIDLVGRRRVLPAIELGHAQVGALGMALTALAVLGVVTPIGISIGWIGLDTVVIALAYVAIVVWVRRGHARRHVPLEEAEAEEPIAAPTGWSRARSEARRPRAPTVRFAGAAAGVLILAPIVARSGQGISETAGIGETLVGTTFMALATSLPELIASLAAVRLGSYDLAVGNLFGSNALNVATLVLVDVAYLEGPLLSAVMSGAIVAAGAAALLLMAVAIAVVVSGEETRIRRLEPDALLLLIAYVGGLVAVSAASP